VRLFVGVELDERVRLACAEAARELDDRLRRARSRLTVRWLPEHNLHITSWFFGEVSDARAAEIADLLRVDWEIQRFELAITGVGVFPRSGPIRIVWVGVGAGAERMGAIYDELTARLEPLGLEPEPRPYHPHVTIGRARETAGSARRARTVLEGADLRPETCEITHITLFQSRLSPKGARYEPLLRVPLKN
jgi:2'-5' RNA ligase